MAPEVRPVAPDEVEAMLLADERGFGIAPSAAGASRSWAEGELDRALVAVDGTEIVGMSRNYTFELTMPGGAAVPVAAVSWVSVVPTHRRRGVLTAMIAALQADARDRGEVASILTASESHIYGRFGYGIATWRLGIHAERARVEFVDPEGALERGSAARFVRIVDRATAEPILRAVYDRARRLRPGMVTRPDFWWPQGFWEQLGGAEKAFFVAVTGSGGDVDGYVAYEITGDWTAGLFDRQLVVSDLQSTTPAAHAALWRYVFGVDLVATVAAGNVAVDDPVRLLVRDPRRIRVEFVNDGLWLRPLDVHALLAARSYAVPGRLVIEVHSGHGSDRFVLDATPDGATCTPSTAAPDLVCSGATLGALVLGGNRWGAFARAGRVDEAVPGALARADAMFAADPAPAMLSYF